MQRLRISFVREVFNRAMREEITFSKAVELLNERAGFQTAPYVNTGIDLIACERMEQVIKHQRKIEDDFKYNDECELAIVASYLCTPDEMGCKNVDPPEHWSEEKFNYMMNKLYKDRLIIAGALIAAEIDRLNFH